VVGDESTEALKERLKGWVELGASSSLLYHKKQSLLNKVPSSSVCPSVCTAFVDLYRARQKSNPLGKILYLWNCRRYTCIYQIYRVYRGRFCPHILQILLK